ncbi:unnamed protein product [Protopolystoma xenopodis]|uniref:Uncharacterized protein n=1 Tax=Protopolystoma xenopodis TaxID=117903 RepID=A0A3S4ZXB6_9PLAT|nr:unnamed protein product [Protopolystoma xenopodis]
MCVNDAPTTSGKVNILIYSLVGPKWLEKNNLTSSAPICLTHIFILEGDKARLKARIPPTGPRQSLYLVRQTDMVAERRCVQPVGGNRLPMEYPKPDCMLSDDPTGDCNVNVQRRRQQTCGPSW